MNETTNNNATMKTCYYCGNEVETSNGVQWGRYFYCDECFKAQKCRVDGYHCPSIETSFKKSNNDDENEKLFLGIELETTKDIYSSFRQSDHVDDVFFIRKNFKELGLNFETDSSIGNGMEIITQPMTYKYIKENEDKFKSIFEYLTSQGNHSHDGGKCGLHIHVSKNALGDNDEMIQKTIEKLMLFVETYRPLVEKFARRKHNEFSHYNSYTLPYHKDNYGNESCFKNEDYYKSGKLLYELQQHDCIGHSSVINPCASTGQTIEFRMFRGTLKFETFMATIEFINNLVHVCRDNQASKIGWQKVIEYGGDYIKDYNAMLNVDELLIGNQYLRDHTAQIESLIDKYKNDKKEVIENYKKDLNTIDGKLKDLLNEPIDFTSDYRIIRDTLKYRENIYSTLTNIVINDSEDETSQTLYGALKNMSSNYNETCTNYLKLLKRALKTYTSYNVTDTTITNAKETIKLIDERLSTIPTEQVGY